MMFLSISYTFKFQPTATALKSFHKLHFKCDWFSFHLYRSITMEWCKKGASKMLAEANMFRQYQEVMVNENTGIRKTLIYGTLFAMSSLILLLYYAFSEIPFKESAINPSYQQFLEFENDNPECLCTQESMQWADIYNVRDYWSKYAGNTSYIKNITIIIKYVFSNVRFSPKILRICVKKN